jgi:23S rRNA (uridine2552-2'-O)-methyltransferase
LKHSPRSRKNPWEDHYAQQARKEHFPARSVFKLQEIQQKIHLIRRGNSVLDLGCSPGSWLMLAATLTGPTGRVVGIDLKPVSVSLPAYVFVFISDILTISDEISQAIGRDFHVLLSDMAPATTGSKSVDAVRSLELCQAALSIAENRLLPGGAFVCKIFQGEDFEAFNQRVKSLFHEHRIFKPRSSRKASREIYIIGRNKR